MRPPRGVGGEDLVHLVDMRFDMKINLRWAVCEQVHGFIKGLHAGEVPEEQPTTCLWCSRLP